MAVTAPVDQILMEIREKPYLKWPLKMKSNLRTISKKRYYRFHCNHSHDTTDFIQLKDAIKDLIW